MKHFYYCRDGQTVEGPVSEEELMRLSREFLMPSGTSIAIAGEEEWRPLESILSPERGAMALPPAPVVSAATSHKTLMAILRSWFMSLEFKKKVIVVGCVVLFFAFVFGSSDNVRPLSDGISAAESEAWVGAMEANIPQTKHTCPECRGNGELANTRSRGLFGSSNSESCETCYGRGTIRTGSGYDTTCPTCSGLGNPKTRTCYKCGGAGFLWGY